MNIKVIFILLSYSWFGVSKVILSNVALLNILIGLIIFSLSVHWMYAYIFNTNMHNHLGVIKPSEHKTTRLLSFVFGLALFIYTSYPSLS